MGIITSLSIVGLVVAFLINVLGAFPGDETASTTPKGTEAVDESFSVDAVEEVSELFANKYMALIDEMVAYHKDPDYRRVEARREELMSSGTLIAAMYREFGSRVERELGEMTSESDNPVTVYAE